MDTVVIEQHQYGQLYQYINAVVEVFVLIVVSLEGHQLGDLSSLQKRLSHVTAYYFNRAVKVTPTKFNTMKKLSTLYKKNPENLGRIINEVNPENSWAFTMGVATRKFDGTSCAIIGGELYKRFDLKKGRVLPSNAIACQEPDEKSGHHPFWVKCEREDKSNKWHFVAFDVLVNKEDGTYELCGEKVQGNPEKIEGHQLIRHGSEKLEITDLSFEGLRSYLEQADIEGIVFHHKDDDRMCKIRKTDFGIKRNR